MTYRNGCMVLLLLLGGIKTSTAQEEIRITVPNDLENLEGDWTGPPNFMGTPFRFQDLYLASEFAALPDTHRNIVGFFLRPDASVVGSRTATYGDFQLRLSTTSRSELDTVFDDNLGDDATIVYQGPLTVSTQATGPPEGPRGFDYHYEYQAPFFYDPAAGNLVIDLVTFTGFTPAQRDDQYSGSVSMFGSPGAAEGGPLQLGLIVQFRFVASQEIPGDFNGDGTVDLTDFNVLVSNFSESFDVAKSFSKGDINLDRIVDLHDFLDFRKIFNDQSVAAVPEPSSIILGVIGLVMLIHPSAFRIKKKTSFGEPVHCHHDP